MNRLRRIVEIYILSDLLRSGLLLIVLNPADINQSGHVSRIWAEGTWPCQQQRTAGLLSPQSADGESSNELGIGKVLSLRELCCIRITVEVL